MTGGGALIPFGWQRIVGTVSRPLDRHAVGHWVNLRLSATDRITMWQHGVEKPLMRQGNLKDKWLFQQTFLMDWLHTHLFSSLTPDGSFDASMYFNQQVTHTVPSHTCSVQHGLQVQCIPAHSLMFPWDIHFHPSVPHGSGELPVQGVHGQEQPAETKHQPSVFNVFHKGQQVIIFQYYLKLGCGVILGVFPSMTPRSFMMRDPPGSRRALRRSSTEALRPEHIMYLCICTSTTELLRFFTLRFNSKCYLTPSQRICSF